MAREYLGNSAASAAAEFVDGYDQWCEAEYLGTAATIGDIWSNFHHSWARLRLQDGSFVFIDFYYNVEVYRASTLLWSKAIVCRAAEQLPNDFIARPIAENYRIFNRRSGAFDVCTIA